MAKGGKRFAKKSRGGAPNDQSDVTNKIERHSVITEMSRSVMKLIEFRVCNYRNIIDSGWIEVGDITALVGQNESGKSNLCEALYRLNPFDSRAVYNIDEDWPADRWGNRDATAVVCEAKFLLDDPAEIADLFEHAGLHETVEGSGQTSKSSKEEGRSAEDDDVGHPELPDEIQVTVSCRYDGKRTFSAAPGSLDRLDHQRTFEWLGDHLPKCVYIQDYELSGTQTELNELASRLRKHGWNNLSAEDQTILTVLDLAHIDIDDFLKKGETAEGRTLRSFDKRQASAYLTAQFARLWRQKKVRFDIEIDATTLNIFVEDEGLAMPVRLARRSTGARWYVSFAWKFTYASSGEYKNCILLLEEPGIHLHYAGHRDLLALFEELSEGNTTIYTTHLATMLDPAYPERIRIVEVHDHHASVRKGVVSGQKQPMMVIEAALGLTGTMGGMLGNRQNLVVEGGDDAIILHKLSGILARFGREGLSDRIYLWPAEGASKTPMYAGFLIGNGWDAGVLLDSDHAGENAKQKINDLYLNALADTQKFRIFMLGKAAGISKPEAAIEDLFPDIFYLDCVGAAYRIAIVEADLPEDGSPLISKRVEKMLKERGFSGLHKGRVMSEMLKRFERWEDISDLPPGTADRAEKLFKTINGEFSGSTSS